MARRLEAVVFDVGETLVDETPAWTAEAERAGVPAFTLFGLVGALIERGEDHRQVWPLLDLAPPSPPVAADAGDLYPDARPAIEAARAAGLRVGAVGNQPAAVEGVLLDLGLDLAGSSERWGVAKPDPAFFARISAELDLPAAAIAYVGDRLDLDVGPARAAGMTAVFVRRGPWGHIHARRPDAAEADVRIDDLAALVPALCRIAALGPAPRERSDQ